MSPEELEVRADDLGRRYHATPNDDAVAEELGDVLARLGRAHELLALFFGRIEGADATRRDQLVPWTRSTLARLEREARGAGRATEADVYAEGLQALDDQ